MDDIPEALRDRATPRQNVGLSEKLPLPLIGIGLVLLSIIGGFSAANLMRPTSKPIVVSTPSPSTTPTPNATPTPTPVENVLGHLPYKEAPTSELSPISADGRILLRKAAAEKYRQMQAAARRDGVSLMSLSGFRSLSEQEYLFFKVKEKRNQEAKKRAEVSAPPGYSEHHTGYAIDIGDGRTPATNLSQSFEKTSAFRWLQNHASKYSFELSFPPNNPQGVSYEPWHWRFVGDTHSLETFYKAQQLKKVK
ncbi:D-alanyl-D-alanine carboxypeptidase [Aphanothece hegewaldii CCALA 016]|uniref:D-alanyl-D-alanine carboxypeptidase n=1 Tax=Aphanothece hegewaldii CCALA 016 TaxID=2107694 RepID=A0A2T1LTY6_9CHRO|nr:M15 family metallopeptidase [Aphanothece hegewaldii]PSF34571.1 D-alanyl-D-alanine carboxypeptidase [Aphanothece hegewaldii CCALA 016]